MIGRAKRLVKGGARRGALVLRRAVLRLLRPVVLRIDGHLQWLFDRQQDDRARLAVLEREVCALRHQIAALQQQAARRSRAA